MSPIALEKEDHARDAAFNKAMHGKSAATESSMRAMLQKDRSAQQAAVEEYFKHWDKSADEETEDTRKARRDEYATLTRHYYNIATDLYESGWCQSFHFCRFAYGEPFHQAIARHEHYLAHIINIKEGMRVLDVGCGVGGPARQIVKFTGANVIGLNNNDYQIERAAHYAAKEGLSDKLKFTKGDFMQMSFPDNSFDVVYAIEATVHAPSLEGVYNEIFRVLKPGGVFGVYEWVMTEKYDNDNPHHREIRLGIEVGDGISNMEKVDAAVRAMKTAGFELEHHEDMANRDDPAPWYWPISGDVKYISTIGDVLTILRMTKLGRGIVHKFVSALETIGLAPAGTQKAADNLALAADSIVAGAKEKLFTPMYLMVGRKPLNL
ncbi:hypothetical protein BS50DRAFT_558645 [Corynespora cassiicola Philippines]|uniref:Sterol 24-C-methyltransferase n=1 Tax=Corynespora cassiicola Philippines TaxID=1448308 RepID=A0A2T2ND06_CORCC|nr:hypothetical protein BS50DRAFT_558645 [Corynespora cassiicola Philippines]